MALTTLLDGGDDRFQVVSMVVDANPIAEERLLEYYNCPFTVAVFDGGFRTFIIDDYNTYVYDSLIAESGLRPVPQIDLITALDWLDEGVVRVRSRIGNGLSANEAPSSFVPLSGPATGLVGIDHEFSFKASDGDSDSLFYRISWGTGDPTAWLGPLGSEDTLHLTHTWSAPGVYTVTSQAKDMWEAAGEWAPAWNVGVGTDCCIVRGDIDHGNGPDPIDISDLVFMVDYMFTDGPAVPCPAESDLNADNNTDIADLVYLVDFMFNDGASPEACE